LPEGKEDVQSLDEDLEELVAVVAKKVSQERAKQLKDFVGISEKGTV
jgi:hypothetical protein